MRIKTVSVSVLSATLLLGMTVTGLTGCGSTKNADHNMSTKSTRNSTLNNSNRFGMNSVNDNTMSNLRYSKELSDKISKMKQVGSAKVMLTDRNAYVAVSIKDGNTMNGRNTMNGGNMMNGGNTMNGTSTNLDTGINDSTIMGTGTGTGGNMMGLGAPTQNGVTSNVTNQTGGGGNYPTNRDHGYGSLGTSSYGLMRGLTTSPAPGTGNGVGGNDDNITQEVKDMISDKIKKSDSTITNVYVSANPEFVDRVGGYVSDVSNGHPISGIADEFQTLVNRIFPTQSGSNVNNNTTNGPLNNMGR